MKRFFRALRWLVFVAVGEIALFLCTAAFLFWLYLNYAPWGLSPKIVDMFLSFQPPKTVEILDNEGNSLIELPGIENWKKKTPEYRKSVSIGEVSPVMLQAMLAAEDQRFFLHNGVDYLAIFRAAKEVITNSFFASVRCRCVKIVFPQGASTLTQQVVRLVILKEQFAEEQQHRVSKLQKVARKIWEARLALFLERELTKRYGSKEVAKSKVFEVYAEMSYVGHGQYGLSSAAEFYFGKPLREITKAEEAAMIAGIIRDPSRYSPRINPVAAEGRRNRILLLMKDIQNNDEIAKSLKAPISLAELPESKTIAPAAINFILENLWGSKERRRISWINGTRVQSTIVRRDQIAANEAVEYGLKLYRERHPAYAEKIQAAAVVMENTGKIRAMVGGVGTRYTSFNRALARRQPGSAIKPIVYLAALEQGRTVDCTVQQPSCYILDVPISVSMGKGKQRHEIHNYDGRYYGRIQLWQAFAESRNAATMWLFRNLDPGGPKKSLERVIEAANRLGLYEKAEHYPTIAIGAEVVTPLALTAAYITFANGGFRVTPQIIEQAWGPDSTVLVVRQDVPKEEQVLDPNIAKGMMQLLRHTILWQSGTGRALSNLPNWEKKIGLPMEITGKTGTTNDFRDAWFCGSTYGSRGLTACIWVGMDDNTSLGDSEKCKPLEADARKYCESGASVALPIFKKFMEILYGQGYRPEPFPQEINQAVLAAHKYGVVRK